MRATILILTLLLLAGLNSCASSSIVGPGIADPQSRFSANHSTQLWGFWEITGTETGEFDIVPLRHAEFAANVVGWMNSKPECLTINLINVTNGSGYTDIEINISFTHPFDGLSIFSGFDVMGVFMGLGDIPHPFDPTLLAAGENHQQMLNPDGFTRWMNKTEFDGTSMKVLGYQEGVFGTTGYDPTATLNPYKYFCDGIEGLDDVYEYLSAHASDRGVFTPNQTNTRRYVLRFPDETGIKFQYAVVANWAANQYHPDPPEIIPDDFPPEANMYESPAINFSCTASDMWWDGVEGGGNFIGEISVLNWHAVPGDGDVVDDYEIYFYSPAWSGALSPDMTAISYGDNYCTFEINAPVSPTVNGTVDGWITIAHPGVTYENDFGVPTGADDKTLASHWKFTANVSDTNPDPDPDFWEPPTDRDPRFLFIHHSCGSGFLFTGDMWTKLEDAGFEVHDRTYGDGWVGDNTNPNHWPITFTDYYEDMMTWEMDPGNEYDIVAFKSCYPACNISSDEMLEDYYGYYAIVKEVCQANPYALFVPWSPPPLNKATGYPDRADRARTFSTWLTTTYPEGEFNIAGFDCFDVLAGNNSLSDDFNYLKNEYSDGTNSHPNTPGDIAVADAFTAWLVDVVWP